MGRLKKGVSMLRPRPVWYRRNLQSMQKYRRLIQYARPHWRFFFFIFALTIAASAVAALQPLPLAFLTDHVLGEIPLSASARAFFVALSQNMLRQECERQRLRPPPP